jgi:hypothetical protein
MFMVVTVTSRNLHPVVHAIPHGQCSRITELHFQQFGQLKPDEPVINCIKIVAAGEGV